MSARASKPGPPLLWAAALAALAPDAYALSDDKGAPEPSRTEPAADDAGESDPRAELAAACARWSVPLGEADAPPPARAYIDDATSHALAVRYGAPLVAATTRAPYDPWIGAAAERDADIEAEPRGAPLISVLENRAYDAADDEIEIVTIVVPRAEQPSTVVVAMAQFAAEAVAPIALAATAPKALSGEGLTPVDDYEEGEGDKGGEVIPPPDPLAPQPVRRRPGPDAGDPATIAVPLDPNAVAPPQYSQIEACEGGGDALRPCAVAIPDRWRLAENLGLIKPRWWDPYNQNTLKGDRPVPFLGEHWFFVGSAISDTVVEPRSFPTPMGVQTADRAGSLDVFGDANSLALSQTVVLSAALIEGSTAFKPQDLEFRVTLAANLNHAEVEERRILYVRPQDGTERTDGFVGVQELFAEKHLRNVSTRYDFDSLRVGIQPFSSDFRGFLFQDNQLGVRLFGTRNNNRVQYNLAAFARVEKDANSGLNDLSDDIRRDYVVLANLYRQDTPVPGVTSQLTAVYNMNREADEIEVDTNGFPVRPALLGNVRGREYDVGYVGYNADGRIGRLNLTASAYYAFGEDRSNAFTGKESVIRSYFVAAEPSVDFDWLRVRGSALMASGDDNPYDDVEEGFDAIFENPQFAGADTSYWIRQSIPFVGGGRAIGLNGRNGVLPSLRSSKEQGQSNFINPGIALVGVGADADVLPELRLSTSVNHLSFVHTEPLEALRMQGRIPNEIGWDLSAAATYRPGFIQNFVFRLSGAALAPGDGFKALFDNNKGDDFYYSVLFNATLSY